MIRENAVRWSELLSNPHVGARPSEEVWSALEYGCHVRDVFRLYDARLQMMIEEDDPTYPNWDQNTAAVDERYDQQAPSHVAKDLGDAAMVLSRRLDALTEAEWERRGTRSDGARFTVESCGRYLIHDPIHHVHDVEHGFARLDAG